MLDGWNLDRTLQMSIFSSFPHLVVAALPAPCKRGGQGAGAGWASGVLMGTSEPHRVKNSHVGASLTVKIS